MKFFKGDAPPIKDYDKTVSELLKLGWLLEIFDVESNKSIYQITDLGYQYYFAICLVTGYEQLFNGPKQIENPKSAVDADMNTLEEGYVVEGRDSLKLTPTGAEYLYVLIDAHDKEIGTGGGNIKASKSGAMNKIGKYSAMFMKGVQQASKAAQEYDKQSTAATQNFWGEDKPKSACPNCDYLNKPKSKFCVKCGTAIRKRKRSRRGRKRSRN